MNKIKRIIVIDDDLKIEDRRNKIISSFQDSKVDLILCQDKDCGLYELNRLKNIDCVVLDWYLGEGNENSMESRLILKHLSKISFTPVIIYSAHIPIFLEEFASGEIEYPANLIRDIDKGNVSYDKIFNIVDQWFKENKVGQLSSLYRNHILAKLEKVFFEFNSLPASNLSSVLKVLAGKNLNVDWSNDIILNLIHRKLIGDPEFCGTFTKIISSIPSYKKSKNKNHLNTLINKLLYYSSSSGFINNGDIVEIQSGYIKKYGIVITPDCDIEQENTRFICLIELRDINDTSIEIHQGNPENIDGRKQAIKNQSHTSYYYFPAVKIDNSFIDFVALFKTIITLEETQLPTNIKYPASSHRLKYDSRFLFNNQKANLKLICSKSNPYKSDFFHALHSHNSRVGTPDIKNLWK